jgi:hypothetical protein
MRMSDVGRVTVGTAVNLLLGIQTGWDASDPASSPFFAPSEQSMARSAGKFADAGHWSGPWNDPQITLHDSAESVLSAIYDLPIVNGTSDGANASYDSGALLICNADRDAALAELQQEFGVDFGVSGRGYALIEVRREAGTDVHATFASGVYKMPGAEAFEGRALPRAILKLPHAEQKLTLGWGLETAESATAYLDLFARCGTHYVSSIMQGDRILQVFAYNAQQWQQVRSDFANFPQYLQGPTAYQKFLYYIRPLTTDDGGNVYGMVAQRGDITISSRDTAFAKSVTAGQWRDAQWAQGDCILAPWLGASIALDSFGKLVPIRITLSPLSLVMNHARERAAWSVFRAAMAAIYADAVYPAFPSANPQDFDDVYPVRRQGILSDLATPTISAYVQRFDLSSLQLALPEVVQQFGIFANLLEWRGAGGPALPGTAVALLSHIVNVTAAADGSVPTLTVTDEAYAGFSLSCAKFVGGLYVTDTSATRRQLIADGIRYERGPVGQQGRYTARATGDVHGAPTLTTLQSLSSQLAAGSNAASASLAAWQAMAPQGRVRLLIRFADWMTGLIPNDCPDQKLQGLRLDALSISRAAQALVVGTRQVPYLTFKAYEPAVQAITTVAGRIQDTLSRYQDRIEQRKIAESLITDLKAINQNVIDTGKLLTDYFQACAQHQQDLAASYAGIAAADQQTLEQTNKTVATLQTDLDDQRAAVSTAIDRYKVAIGNKETEEIVKLSFEIAESIFELGASVAGGGEEGDAKQLKELFEDIQKIVALLGAINKLAEAIKGGEEEIAAADAAFTALGSAPLPTAALLNWDEFRVRMKTAIEKGPAMGERDDAEAAIDVLVLRGKALVETQESAANLITRIFQEQRRETMAQDQSTRLQDLTSKLDPANVQDLDLANIDLVGLTGELDQLQAQMLAQLVRTVVIQDLALQYEYLQQPTAPPSAFDLISVGVYIAAQQSALIDAKSALDPPPTAIEKPVSYVIAGIPPDALAGGRAFKFQIPLAAPEFLPFTMVRFSRLDLTVEGIGGTAGEQFVVRLLYRGDPFYDRDQQRNAIKFSTSPRVTNYLGTVTPGAPSSASAGEETSGDYSQVTPFSDWEISFPTDGPNTGLGFSGSVKLTLSFYLTAQINPGAKPLRLAATDGPGTYLDMLAAMQGKTCLNGWDAVFSYTEDKINAFLLAEYQKLKKENAGYLVIPLRTDTTPPDPNTGIATFTTWAMTLGPPRVQFQTNNSQYASVYLDILDAQYAYGFVLKNGDKVTQTSFPPPPLPDGSYIRGDVKLSSVQGVVNTQRNVILDLPSGSWEGLPDVSTGNPSFNTFLTQQLATVSTAYPLGTLDTQANPQLPALTPISFQFAVATTKAGLNLLQLFIVTDGSAQTQLYLEEVPEPVPSGYDCSLLISSRILFNKILPASFSQAKSLMTLAGDDPNDPLKTWTATATSGTVSFPITVDDSDYRVDSPANVSLAGLKIAAGAAPDYGLDLSYTSGFPENFTHHECTEGHFQGECLGDEWVPYTVNVTTTASATIALSVQKQQIQMAVSDDSSVQADGDIDSGPCKGGPIQEKILDAYRVAARPAIKTAITVQLSSISFMALNSLLFPSGNMVNMSAPYSPGDLVILGTFAAPTQRP